jgi:hypothetical protein
MHGPRVSARDTLCFCTTSLESEAMVLLQCFREAESETGLGLLREIYYLQKSKSQSRLEEMGRSREVPSASVMVP